MSGFRLEADGLTNEFSVKHPESFSDLASLLAARGFQLNTRCGGEGWCHGCELELHDGVVRMPEGLVHAPVRFRACRAHLEEGEVPRLRIPTRGRVVLAPKVEDSFSVDPVFELDPPFAVSPGVRDLSFAVDVGTTTVVVVLANLSTGAVLSRAGAYNAQIRFGDNVLTRIGCASTPGQLDAMRRAILDETIRPLLLRACERANRPLSRIAGGAISGNTTMLHLLLGVDPSAMGQAPFTPTFLEARRISVRELGLQVQDVDGALDCDLPVLILPGLSAYVGADLTAGVHVTEMSGDPKPSLLVDIGTNGEMVLQANKRLFATATAAGPAFEGSGLFSGTRAHEGAISGVTIADGTLEFTLKTIGDLSPSSSPGLCGTAYVDFLAEARRVGLLMPNGRFDKAVYARLPDGKKGRSESGLSVALVGNLQISEADVAQLLHAKAAIAAGVDTLLAHAGIKAPQIGRVYLAGGFGMHLNQANTLAIGMLPGFTVEQIEVVGNTSLAGALIASLDRAALSQMDTLRGEVTIVELNEHPGFEDCFIDHLSLP